jgi:SAM-dependent methyltransferase
MSTDFNKYADNYKNEIDKSICFSGQSAEFFTEIKAQLIIRLAEKLSGDITKLNVLDLGCGIGQTDSFLVNRFSTLYGIDVARAAVERARTVNPTVHYEIYDGLNLPFNEGTFDIVITICVMHHLRLIQRKNFVSEMKRVLKSSGLIMIFEHNPFNYLTRCSSNK